MKTLLFPLLLLAATSVATGQDIPFTGPVNLDPTTRGATSVQIADFNGDGRNDIAVFEGGKANKESGRHFKWFRAPDWEPFDFNTTEPGPFIGHSAVADMDGDGLVDLIIPEDAHSGPDETGRVFWYKNPGNGSTGNWPRTKIKEFTEMRHIGGISVKDMDNDGKLDVVIRHLGPGASTYAVRILFQNTLSDWTERKINVRRREGILVTDVDQDGINDILLNGFWWTVDNDWRTDEVMEFVIDDAFYTLPFSGLNNSTKNGQADLDGDGLDDVVISVAEGAAVYLAWYKQPANPRTEDWPRTILEEPWTGGHTVQIQDMEGDGDFDIVTGRAFGEDGVYIWRNDGTGSFTKQVLDEDSGMYYGVVGDIGDDGDMDIVMPESYSSQRPIHWFENLTYDDGPAVQLDLTVGLQGAMPGELPMVSGLRVPDRQPFGTDPWSHAGGEMKSPELDDAVDWVLLEFRTTPDGPVVATHAAILMPDGRVTAYDGTTPLKLPGLAAGEYFVVVRHRNHLSVISTTTVSISPP